MKRRTNLFYLSGDDSNYITFSNYTESLTGTILSTDNKLFPSKFLCFNIDYKDGDKESININIKRFLVRYYENKLATLRDYCIKNNILFETKLKPLNYLLEAFKHLETVYDIEITLTYVGEISEQDYNGIYNDMICTIDSNNKKRGKIIYDETIDENTLDESDIVKINDKEKNSDNIKYLYGWDLTSLNGSYYETSYPIFDNYFQKNENNEEVFLYKDHNITDEEASDIEGKYFINSNIIEIDYSENNNSESLEFDIVVPLYDIVDINYKTNYENQDETYNKINLNKESIEEKEDLCCFNIPHGIWFSNEKIILKRDNESNFGPSWSLVLSSQFKPFPYSKEMPVEITKTNKEDAYYTFAQILARQNEILDEFYRLNNTISNLSKRLVEVESKLNTIGCSYTVDQAHREMIKWEKEQNDKFNELEDTVYTYLSNFNWKFRQG